MRVPFFLGHPVYISGNVGIVGEIQWHMRGNSGMRGVIRGQKINEDLAGPHLAGATNNYQVRLCGGVCLPHVHALAPESRSGKTTMGNKFR